jgi:basic amino acid/polyamine antiporter, APA family
VNGVLPAMLARNNRHGAPMAALLVTGLFASAMIAMSYSQSLVAAFTFITRVVTAANLPLYLACALGLAAIWLRDPDRGRRRGVMASATIGTLYVVFALVGLGGEPFLYALGLIALGLPLYAVMRRSRKMPDPAKA